MFLLLCLIYFTQHDYLWVQDGEIWTWVWEGKTAVQAFVSGRISQISQRTHPSPQKAGFLGRWQQSCCVSFLKVRVLVAQLCPTLWDPMDCSPPGSSVHEILQARSWSGLPFPSSGDLPDAGTEPSSPTLQILYCLSRQGSPRRVFRRASITQC